MKTLLLAFLVVLFMVPATTFSQGQTPKMLTDGWYYADVSYYNYATYTSADYTLKVKVKDGIVFIIRLNNGGVVHNLVNSQGYMYTGGKLVVTKDTHTSKLEYTTQVSISTGSSISSYSISIVKEAPDEKE